MMSIPGLGEYLGMSSVELLSAYSFYYPLFMAYLWMTGAIFYYIRYERPPKSHRDLPRSGLETPPVLAEHPLVTIIVPCHNEGRDIEDTVEYLLASTYPNFDILLVNDGSSDETREILDELAAQHPKIRVIHFARNQGKAVALNTGSLMTSAQYLCCIDGDALLDPEALSWLMVHFLNPRVGAVTGNPRVRNRSTLLGRLQVGEFSSIVGLIKRAQRTYGRIFTVSGVVACFRKAALHDVDYWSPAMLTEDIDVSWKLQIRHWDVRFEPKAQCWILAPETLRGLWQQRLRWSTGGIQVMLKNWRIQEVWAARRMWPVLVEYVMSVCWAYVMLAVILLWLLGLAVDLPPQYRIPHLLSGWNGVIVGSTCLIQIAVSLVLDSRYDSGSLKSFYWMIWYPLAYWMLNLVTTIVAVPRALLRNTKKRARWTSPDRGLLP
ncbi:MAG TPA: poly-beta-1,6-N-acetyl-D-glucosamine synthase [Methyloradius sp.]